MGGSIFQKLKIPQVVGYIIIGIIIGESGLRIVNKNTIGVLQPFNYFALGLIGFMVGSELRKEIFTKYGRQLINILLCEGIAPFLLVTLFMGFACTLFFGDWKFAWALAILMGAIASATDPASTTNVLNEYRTRGPLTTTIIGIVALDDGLALLLFALASSIAARLVGQGNEGALAAIFKPIYEIGGAAVLGILAGLILNNIIKRYSEASRLLAFSIGTVLIVIGLSVAINVEMILATMTLGIVVVNLTPRKSKEVFKLVEGFTPPIYVLFFVLVGANLNLRNITFPIAFLVGTYLCGTMAGKMAGSNFGARISGAPKSVRRYLPFSLFSQAGIAIGLSILAAHNFPGDVGNTLIIIITTTTFILQIIGPPATKSAVRRAGEVGLNTTEEDFVNQSRASDVMDKNFPFIHKDTSLTEILKIFSESINLYYPVVDEDKKLLGVITVDNIKNTLMESTLSNLLLAYDLVEPVSDTTTPDTPLKEVRELLNRHNLEYLCVLDDKNKVVGLIERRNLDRIISTKLIHLQKQADSLG